jgi:hypothetical protein
MMFTALGSSALRRGAVLAAMASTLALAACEQHPYPAPVNEAPPAEAPAQMAGGPSEPQPVPGSTQPYTPEGASTAPRSADVTMEPIPNPPEGAGHRGGEAYGYDGSAYGHAPAHHQHARSANGLMAPPNYHVRRHVAAVATAAPHAAPRAAVSKPVATAATAAATAAAAAGRNAWHAAKTTTAQAAKTASAKPKTAAELKAEETARKFDTFKQALSNAIVSGGQLVVTPTNDGQTQNVTLTLPPAFADAARKAAVDAGLATADAQMTVVASLDADGYRIQPLAPQMLQLPAASATELRWSATPTDAAHGQISADVCVEAPTGAQPVCGGAIKAAERGFHLDSHMVGILMLAGITGFALFWLARRNNPPPKPPKRRPDGFPTTNG